MGAHSTVRICRSTGITHAMAILMTLDDSELGDVLYHLNEYYPAKSRLGVLYKFDVVSDGSCDDYDHKQSAAEVEGYE